MHDLALLLVCKLRLEKPRHLYGRSFKRRLSSPARFRTRRRKGLHKDQNRSVCWRTRLGRRVLFRVRLCSMQTVMGKVSPAEYAAAVHLVSSNERARAASGYLYDPGTVSTPAGYRNESSVCRAEAAMGKAGFGSPSIVDSVGHLQHHV